MEIAGLILGILALILAIFHSFEIGRQARRLQLISDELSTKYIGQFPNFIEDICTCLQEAKKDIVVACDVPAYGVFSKISKSREYIDILHNKCNNGIFVQLIVQTEEERERVYKRQFKEKSWEELSEDPDFRENLARFQKIECRGASIKDKESLEKKLKEIHNRTFKETTFGSEKYECSIRMPVYFWIIDQRIAIFATPSWEDGNSEHGFMTHDVSLIRALLSIKQGYLEKSDRYST